MARAEQILTVTIPSRKAGVRTSDNALSLSLPTGAHLISLGTAELAALRSEATKRAAELRPGAGSINSGITPRWYLARVAILDGLRTTIEAAEAAGVIA